MNTLQDEKKSARQLVCDVEWENGWEPGELQEDQRSKYFTKILKFAILRLKLNGYDKSKIARALNKSRLTIQKYY